MIIVCIFIIYNTVLNGLIDKGINNFWWNERGQRIFDFTIITIDKMITLTDETLTVNVYLLVKLPGCLEKHTHILKV